DRVHQEGQLLDNCYAGIDLVYTGTGHLLQETILLYFTGWHAGEFQLKTRSEKRDLIYHKPFPTQHPQNLVCTQQHTDAGKWLITTHLKKPLKANEVPIFSYGGVYQPALSLDSVMPVYATLAGSSDRATRVTIRSQKFWHEKGVLETQPVQLGDTIYSFHDL